MRYAANLLVIHSDVPKSAKMNKAANIPVAKLYIPCPLGEGKIIVGINHKLNTDNGNKNITDTKNIE
jgi:hypothetical protein